jgi:hypothetical protein
MHADIERTITNFREILYKGIPVMLRQNETVAAKPDLQTKMVARISDVKKGGAIFF